MIDTWPDAEGSLLVVVDIADHCLRQGSQAKGGVDVQFWRYDGLQKLKKSTHQLIQMCDNLKVQNWNC